jgi:Holliday junction resolvase-like predicted endonuclease
MNSAFNPRSQTQALLSLVGEQPIPNLLVSRALQAEHNLLAYTPTTQRVAHHLQRMLPRASLHQVADYDLPQVLEQLEALCTPQTVINLTAGTKPMALAAYEVARLHNLPLIYLQSEGSASVLYWYEFIQGRPQLQQRQVLPQLITIDDYLRAHGLQPQTKTGSQNAQESGLRAWLEKQVDECLHNLVFEALEIDFVLRRGNRVAVVEAKMSQKNTRQGIDQLNTIAGRAYLGIYTAKILVVAKPLGPQLSRLAEARQIHVVAVQTSLDRRTGRLVPDQASKERLLQALEQALGPKTASKRIPA